MAPRLFGQKEGMDGRDVKGYVRTGSLESPFYFAHENSYWIPDHWCNVYFKLLNCFRVAPVYLEVMAYVEQS